MSLDVVVSRAASADEVNAAFRKAADGQLKPILAYSSDKLVSSDFNHVPASCSFDATQTAAIDGGKLIRICGWYDNEWGFSNRMADTAAAFGAV